MANVPSSLSVVDSRAEGGGIPDGSFGGVDIGIRIEVFSVDNVASANDTVEQSKTTFSVSSIAEVLDELVSTSAAHSKDGRDK